MNPYPKSLALRDIIRRARRITGMLQGTMALEGQGLPKQTLKDMTKRTARELFEDMKKTPPKPTWHLFPNGRVEQGTGAPGYRWSPAYSQITAQGVSQPLTRRHWQHMARRDNANLVFHKDQTEAKQQLQ